MPSKGYQTGARRHPSYRPKQWFAPGGAFDNTPASLGAGSQLTVLDRGLLNPVTSQAYDPGTLVGPMVQVDLQPDVLLAFAPFVVLMVLPKGTAVPSIASESLRKQNEQYIWAAGLMEVQPTTLAAAGITVGTYTLRWKFKTGRRFNMNDRVVIVLLNTGAAGYGAAAAGEVFFDGTIVNQA